MRHCTNLKYGLWDLDGTLAYWTSLGIIAGVARVFVRELSLQVHPVKAILAVARAYKRVLGNTSIRKNDDLFNTLLSSSLHLSSGHIQTLSQKMIQSEAMSSVVKNFIRPIPEAKRLVEEVAQNRKFCQVVATNPIMPSEFNARRLWQAGYDPSVFIHITGSEQYSRQKNHVEFYHELLDLLNARPGECLMVGNDMAKDAIAKLAGIPFFLLENQFTKQGHSPVGLVPDAQGTYETLRTFLELSDRLKD